MLNKSCSLFLEELGSNAAIPGGGSASALTGAIGIALGTMVGSLTTGKKTYAEYEEEIQQLIKESKRLTEVMKDAVQKDIDAFLPLSDAYKMPAGDEEQKKAKKEAVQSSLEAAALAPLELAEACVEALRLLDRYSVIGSKLAISDAGTGAVMCEAALKGARLNVLTNVNLMEDAGLAESLQQRIDIATAEGEALAKAVFSRVEDKLMGR